ncbi:hypothetical protein [Flavobacterium stagni]|uniref:Lipoprotein n=1 Tax=Flavobacterium stagni TaxID=2506421 RepID=A0A4Q1K2D9_9FLAO|nr:hypothetical protein [Flavobacterium stagni]RXR18877.1 hypothetical protein EQG61_13545 [Flavobacterium stagni]
MKHFLAIVTLLFISACTNKPEKAPIDSSKVILSAKILRYEDLGINEKADLKYACYCYPVNWRESVEYLKEDAFYVSCKIDNKLLAQLCESETFKLESLLDEKPSSLYGKYINRWLFMDSLGLKVCEKSKFEGQEIRTVYRKGEIDSIVIGPLITKPKTMAIQILDSKYYKDNADPSFEFSNYR